MSSSASHLSGRPASETPLRKGTAVIPNAGYQIVVNDTNITASSVIVCWGVGAAQAVAGATSFSADVLVPGASFTIQSDQAATADKTVGYAILQY
jgi:hypothetical protein